MLKNNAILSENIAIVPSVSSFSSGNLMTEEYFAKCTGSASEIVAILPAVEKKTLGPLTFEETLDRYRTSIKSPREDSAKKFKRLLELWRKETEYMSSMTQAFLHPAYQEIVGMGKEALPFIFRAMEQNPDWFFWALRAITGENPVRTEHRGRLKEMTIDWIEWAKEKGYIW
jgi:hypothetical protein